MIEKALYSILVDAAGINRVHPSTETVTLTRDLPKIVYTPIDLQRQYCDDGATGLVKGLYQLDVFADRMTEARQLYDIIRASLDGFSGEEDDTQIARISFGSERWEKGEALPGANKVVSRFIAEMTVDYYEI